MRWWRVAISRKSSLRRGSELAMEELEEVDFRFREEKVLRAKQQRAFCNRDCNICNSVTGI